MQEAIHTPGPWSIRKDEGFANDVMRPNGKILATCYPGVLPNGRSNEAGQGEAEANARLISAAPDLLEALTFLLEAVEMDVALFPEQPHKDSRLGKARAAITKATAAESGGI